MDFEQISKSLSEDLLELKQKFIFDMDSNTVNLEEVASIMNRFILNSIMEGLSAGDTSRVGTNIFNLMHEEFIKETSSENGFADYCNPYLLNASLLIQDYTNVNVV